MAGCWRSRWLRVRAGGAARAGPAAGWALSHGRLGVAESRRSLSISHLASPLGLPHPLLPTLLPRPALPCQSAPRLWIAWCWSTQPPPSPPASGRCWARCCRRQAGAGGAGPGAGAAVTRASLLTPVLTTVCAACLPARRAVARIAGACLTPATRFLGPAHPQMPPELYRALPIALAPILANPLNLLAAGFEVGCVPSLCGAGVWEWAAAANSAAGRALAASRQGGRLTVMPSCPRCLLPSPPFLQRGRAAAAAGRLPAGYRGGPAAAAAGAGGDPACG